MLKSFRDNLLLGLQSKKFKIQVRKDAYCIFPNISVDSQTFEYVRDTVVLFANSIQRCSVNNPLYVESRAAMSLESWQLEGGPRGIM